MLLSTAVVIENSCLFDENLFTFLEKCCRPKLKGTNTKFGHSQEDGKTNYQLVKSFNAVLHINCSSFKLKLY